MWFFKQKNRILPSLSFYTTGICCFSFGMCDTKLNLFGFWSLFLYYFCLAYFLLYTLTGSYFQQDSENSRTTDVSLDLHSSEGKTGGVETDGLSVSEVCVFKDCSLAFLLFTGKLKVWRPTVILTILPPGCHYNTSYSYYLMTMNEKHCY